MSHLDKPERLGPGIWRRTAQVDNQQCRSATPCCDGEVTVLVGELSVLGYVTLRCPTCVKLWELRHDPWKPGLDALWIE
ncbi:MAG: hypothetical protein ACRDYA_04585 [Egibacteraceae bacterium]